MSPTVENALDTEIRNKTLDAVHRHKASWIELGQYLFTIHRDKFYRNWGFQSFEGYCKKELRIKQTTAGKLMKSYRFLEREEPQIANQEPREESTPIVVPDYESVNLLRLAKENKQLTPHDIADVRESVIEKAREPKEVRAQVKRIIETKNPQDPEDIKIMKKNTSIKRTVSFLAMMKRQFQADRMVPDYLINQMDDLMEKLEDQLK